MGTRKHTIVDVELAKQAVEEDINRKRREAEKLAEANNPANQRSNRRREILKSKSEVDSQVRKMYDDLAKKMRTDILKNIKLDLYEIEKKKKVITIADILNVFNEHSILFEALEECCSKYAVRQGCSTQYEALFVDLINYDVRFITCAPSEVFKTNNIKLPICRLTELGIDEFTAVVNSLSSEIKKSKGFQDNYLKTFQTAKDQLFNTNSIEV